ncbi:penicillin-binding protein 1A [Asticcacaulis sp. AC460]|nr:penicillin-binding protein 1A [Asticcacaulis sp. AC460]ESQ89806.1 penicillin-binding protein 1A [Asticcacaulis sp. AC460]
MAGVALMTVVAIAGFALTIYAAWLFHDMPDGSELADFRPVNSARVFAWDGTLIGEYGQERRVNVPYDRIPERMRNAFLAAEDRAFFQHSGVDVSGVSRAMLKNVYNFVTGRRFEGGSTITQQVAKNLLLGNERTLGRKLKEVILARRLESSLSKEQILELYMNDIYLGYRSYGVGSAAFNYFGKPVDQLSLAQSAYLAALPKGPENYRPTTHKAAAMARRNWVIDEMAQAGFVTRAEAEEAKKEDLIVQDKPQRAHYHDADYFVSEVELRARKLFPNDPNAIYTDGYYIKTTLDPKLQTYARQALMNGLETYDRRHGWRGAWGNEKPASNWQRIAAEKEPPSERARWIQAIVTSATKGSVAIETITGDKGSLISSDIAWAFAGRGLKTGDLIFVEPNPEGSGYRLRQVPNVNGALVAVDPFTGRTLAMVGGYSYSVSKFNRATQANRQPGSSIKPFVYAVALERDFTPASIVEDGPITMMGGDGKMWSPQNYEHDYMGPQPIRRGIELSRNLMTVRLAQKVGIKPITQKLVEYGISEKVPAEMSMVLGAGEVTPFNLTGAYSIFVNGGRKIRPHLIDQVLDRDGKVVYKADDRACPVCAQPFNGTESPRLTAPGQSVMNPITAYQVNSFMQGVVERGTARSAASLGIPMGGKTGTTNDYRSAWFVGFTADMVVGVFVGFDDNHTLGDKETGSQAALPIWIDFMRNATKGKPKKDFQKPRDAVFVSIRGREEAFKPGTEPKYQPGAEDDGPRPYLDTWTDGDLQTPAPVEAPTVQTPAAPKKKTLDDASELY